MATMTSEPAAVDGRAARWSGQHERRRAQFVEAALDAIAEHGPDVSTDQIAQRAGVARTRLYKHFAGAADLNRSIAARAVELVTAELEPVWNPQGSPMEMISTAVSTHLRWLTEHGNLYRYLTKRSLSGSADGPDAVTDVKSSIAQHLSALFDTYFELLGIEGVPAEPLGYGLVGYVDAAATRWLERPGDVTLDEMIDQLTRAIWAVLDEILERHGIVLDPSDPLPL